MAQVTVKRSDSSEHGTHGKVQRIYSFKNQKYVSTNEHIHNYEVRIPSRQGNKRRIHLWRFGCTTGRTLLT